MNGNVFEGKWKQMRGQSKVWWRKLTDDDLEKIGVNLIMSDTTKILELDKSLKGK